MRWLSEGIRCLIDIGAAHGEYTLYGLLCTGAEKVISFEPSHEGMVLLLHNLQLNSLEEDLRLEVHAKYVGDTTGTDCVSADDLARSIVFPCLIKMDIDGGEVTVLRAAAKNLLAMHNLRWLTETHSSELESECIDILQSAGYSTIIISNAWWRRFIPEQRPNQQNRWLIAIK